MKEKNIGQKSQRRTEGSSSVFSAVKNKFILILFSAAAFIVLVWLFLRYSPYPRLKEFLQRPYSVRYYDRYGMLLQITPLAGGLRREKPVTFPQQVKDVFVFAEDRRFYQHAGVDGFSLIRALFQNISQRRKVSGASTITMQLARMIADNAEAPRRRTFSGKISEMFNAFRLETRFSKDEILEMYLNSLPFGFNTEGAASAARNFYSSELAMLSPSQIFCLAVIPRRPGLYNPHDNGQNCVAAASQLQKQFAADKILSRRYPLLAQVDEDDWRYAFESAKRFQYPFELPHLIRGINEKDAASGEKRLSIDLALQHYLERAVAGNVMTHYSSRITNGAALVIDNETGEILAWVGSARFFDEEAAGQIDGVLALNQPGSSMKPFLYAMALENGFSPTDVLADIPMTFGESEVYIPMNFNDRFNGPMLLRSALASSLNIPAVYLLYRLSVNNYSQLLFSLGFDSIRSSAQDAGLGLSLGNAPVSLLELVRAFSIFPRDGIFIPLVWELGAGQPLKEEKRIFSADTSRIICSFLSDSSARVLAFGSGRNFRTSFPAIFKTGTANQYQSIVALGATVKYSAGVWMGNFTGETVMGRTGSSLPAAIVRNTLTLLHGDRYSPALSFRLPENWRTARICAVSGMEPTEACPSVIAEYVRFDQDREPCTWHRIVNNRTETVYPAEYQSWFTAFLRQGSLFYASSPLEIINPRGGFVYLSGSRIGMDEVQAEVIGGEEDTLTVTHNGRTFAVKRPFIFYLPRIKGANTLHVQNGIEEHSIVFTIE